MPDKITKEQLESALCAFFKSEGFQRVTTPELIPAPVPEAHIDFFETDGKYLRPSPEIEMKIMIAQGAEKIFQIGKCHRKGEHGRLHRETFTMLEWYEKNADYADILDFTKKMLNFVAENLFGRRIIPYGSSFIDFSSEWYIFTIHQLFAEYAGITPEEAIESDSFETILVEKIEPRLPSDKPLVIKDYPAHYAALAQLKKSNPAVAERRELYLGGIEIANTYTELTDPEENMLRFTQLSKEREKFGLPEIPFPEKFFTEIEKNFPDCAGSALGVDRLLMILNNEKTLS